MNGIGRYNKNIVIINLLGKLNFNNRLSNYIFFNSIAYCDKTSYSKHYIHFSNMNVFWENCE